MHCPDGVPVKTAVFGLGTPKAAVLSSIQSLN
jgi:hypothetical protein